MDWILIPKKNIHFGNKLRLIRTPSGWERQSRGTFESCTWANRWGWEAPLNLGQPSGSWNGLRCELYEPMQRLDAGNIDNYFIIATWCLKKKAWGFPFLSVPAWFEPKTSQNFTWWSYQVGSHLVMDPEAKTASKSRLVCFNRLLARPLPVARKGWGTLAAWNNNWRNSQQKRRQFLGQKLTQCWFDVLKSYQVNVHYVVEVALSFFEARLDVFFYNNFILRRLRLYRQNCVLPRRCRTWTNFMWALVMMVILMHAIIYV